MLEYPLQRFRDFRVIHFVRKLVQSADVGNAVNVSTHFCIVKSKLSILFGLDFLERTVIHQESHNPLFPASPRRCFWL